MKTSFIFSIINTHLYCNQMYLNYKPDEKSIKISFATTYHLMLAKNTYFSMNIILLNK